MQPGMPTPPACARRALAALLTSVACATTPAGDGEPSGSSSTDPTTGTSTGTTTFDASGSSTTDTDSQSTGTEATSTGDPDTSGSSSVGDASSSSDTSQAPPPYGPCGACGPDEEEVDGGPWCICAPTCEVGSDCPDPGTGAELGCSGESGVCVLLCTSSDECPEGARCPDPADLPEGAQGFCYRDRA